MANYNKILVTGACGLIGREVVRQLVEQGHTDITAVDNEWKYQDVELGPVKFVKSSLVDFLQVTPNTFDIVYHLSAINGTKYFYTIPNQLIENNVISDIEIFKWAKTGHSKLIYASTSEVVADSNTVPTPEELDVTIKNIHNPRWSYRIGKILSENYLANSELDYLIIRFFNTYSEHTASGHVVRDLIEKIHNQNFVITGADETRSFCYVRDAVKAVIDLAQTTSRTVVNVGSDEELKIQQVADILAESQNCTNITWTLIPSLEGSVKRRKPDIAKLRQLVKSFEPESFQSVIKKIKNHLTSI